MNIQLCEELGDDLVVKLDGPNVTIRQDRQRDGERVTLTVEELRKVVTAVERFLKVVDYATKEAR